MMLCSIFRPVRRMAAFVALATWFGLFDLRVVGQEAPGGIAASKIELLEMTSQWKGERSSDGRPRVADDLLQRLKSVSIEEAWEVLRQHGYENQFVGGWQMIHPDRPFVGRA